MSLSDSAFLIEINVEQLKSNIHCKEFYINSQFADVFNLSLKDPNDSGPLLPKCKTKKSKKVKINKNVKIRSKKKKAPTGQSMIFTSNIESLISNMKQYPIKISLWDKDDPSEKIGTSYIPWTSTYINYLNELPLQRDTCPPCVSAEYNVVDEVSCKSMATVTLKIKLTNLDSKMTTTSFHSLSTENQIELKCNGTAINSCSRTINSSKDAEVNMNEAMGLIKTIYSSSNKKISSAVEVSTKLHKKILNPSVQSGYKETHINSPNKMNGRRMNIVHSCTDLIRIKHNEIIKTKSCYSMNHENFTFGSNGMPSNNQVYVVGYFTVDNIFNSDLSKSTSRIKSSLPFKNSEHSDTKSKAKYKHRICDSECVCQKTEDGFCHESIFSFEVDLPADAADLISFTECKQIVCNSKKHGVNPTDKPNEDILLDLHNAHNNCCNFQQYKTVHKVAGDMKTKMKSHEHSCMCSCECMFGFTKKTTYCSICGGYEQIGDNIPKQPVDKLFPCPIFHNLEKKAKPVSVPVPDTRRRCDDSQKSTKTSVEYDKDGKRSKKKKTDDRFKFIYGFTGIPARIGHSQCAIPCTGTLDLVPKTMGWLWTADNVAGLKFRPMWKPGGINKHVLRLLRMAKYPGESIKKKKKDVTLKPPAQRPLLIVEKKNGEYLIKMETMKQYPEHRPRAKNQLPYEDKPIVSYTIGRTEEENYNRRRKKERQQRRLERDERNFIQNTFRDMCKEICLKTYQQALGLLPNAEDPKCQCYPAQPGEDKTNLDLSCSCSEENISSFGSDTDSDEWIVEFTPPIAAYDPTFKGKKIIKTDNESQYSYMDYRVKLYNFNGDPIPRFFKGPDGKQQCSDLGGFWGPDHQWLEINSDGFIAPDGRWAPMIFTGPNGEQVDCNGTGKFQIANGNILVVGIDGYVNCHGKWKFYPRPHVPQPKKRGKKVNEAVQADSAKTIHKDSDTNWSCLGKVSPRQLSKMGILGHGHDKKLLLRTLQNMIARGEDVTIPQPPRIPRLQATKKSKLKPKDQHAYFLERTTCKHPTPSAKGIVAIDELGHKTYFRIKNYKNKRPKHRLDDLKNQGISVSSFHVPCFHSFINREMMKQQQYERLMANERKSKGVATKAS